MANIKIFLAALTTFFGFSAFVAFLVLKNYNCAVLGFLAGTADSVQLLLHILVQNNKLKDWYTKSQLKCFTRFSIFFMLIGLACTIYFATLELQTKTSIMPIESSKVLPLIWCVILTRGAVVLLYFSLSYQKCYETNADGENQRLLRNEETAARTNYID